MLPLRIDSKGIVRHSVYFSCAFPSCGMRLGCLKCRYVSLCVVASIVIFKAYLSFPPLPPTSISPSQVKNNKTTSSLFQHVLHLVPSTNASSRKVVTAKKPTNNSFQWSVGETFNNSTLHPLSSPIPMIFVVTPTYRRLEQLAELTRLSQTLMHVPSMHWIVVEDAVAFSGSVRLLLRRVGLNFTHMLAPKPNRFTLKTRNKKLVPRGVSNRIAALRWVQSNVKSGVLYFADDDNSYDIRLFEEMRWTKKVSMWPVGLVTNLAVSSPVVSYGRVTGFYDGWIASRKFPVDMAGFAVNIAFLLQHPNVTMPFSVGYEEDGFLRSLNISVSDIEPKADNCTKGYGRGCSMNQLEKVEECQVEDVGQENNVRSTFRMAPPFLKNEIPKPGWSKQTLRTSGQLPYRLQDAANIRGYALTPFDTKWFSTNSEYGNTPYKNAHRPKVYHGIQWRFSEDKYRTGMYRQPSMTVCMKDK